MIINQLKIPVKQAGCIKRSMLVSEKEMTVTYKKPENVRSSSVKIPENIIVDGKVYKVTAIGDGAFKNNKKLKKITISKNVVTIGKEAFKGCSNLKNIRIKSLELTKSSVGKNAFKGCTLLK